MTVRVVQSQGWRLLAIVMTGVLILHSPLIFNPGYLSHDELQWAYHAIQHQGPAFIEWHVGRCTCTPIPTAYFLDMDANLAQALRSPLSVPRNYCCSQCP